MGTELEPGVFLSSEEASLRGINYRATLNRAQRGAAAPPRRHCCPSCGLFSKWRIPLLSSPRGGVAERSRKYRVASAFCEDGVVFRSLGQGTPPRRRP